MINIPSPNLRAQGIQVEPLTIITELTSGESTTKQIFVRNITNTDLRVELTPTDFDIRENGGLIYHEAKTLVNSLINWLTLQQKEVLLKPGEKKKIPVRINVPNKENETARWGCIMVESSNPKKEANKGGLEINVRYAVLFFQQDPNIKEKGKITSMSVSFSNAKDKAKRKVVVRTKFHNPTPDIILTSLRFEIRNQKGEVIAVDEKGSIKAILPNHDKIYKSKFPLSDLQKGQYLALVLFDYGASNKVGGQYLFEIPAS